MISPHSDFSERQLLGDLLLARQLITEEQLKTALEIHRTTKNKLGTILIAKGYINGMDLVRVLTEQHKIDYLEIEELLVDPGLVSIVPGEVALRYHFIPLIKLREWLFVATNDQFDLAMVEKLEKTLKHQLEIIPIQSADLDTLINKVYKRLAERKTVGKKIGELLLEEKMITPEQLEEALNIQRRTNQRIGKILAGLGYVQEKNFCRVLAGMLGIPFIAMNDVLGIADRKLVRSVSERFAVYNLAFPFAREDHKVRVLVSDHLDSYSLDCIRKATGTQALDLYLCSEDDIRSLIGELYTDQKDLKFDVKVEDIIDIEPLDPMSVYTDPNISKVVNYVLYQAIKERASDIHLEQYSGRVDVKLRIDGHLLPMPDMPIDTTNINRVISRLKIDARLDIVERRRPQDGSIRKRFAKDTMVDFRISIQPTLYGENVVIRVLNQSTNLPTLQQLGFPADFVKRYQRLTESPQGLILFAGPTGSGKTTTLYSTLNILRLSNKKIITAEDPIEYNLDGIQQCQVNDVIGNTFAKFLRGFLRQDPDIILIGEIRDEETAEMAIKAATIGRLIFSTLHTNDTTSIVRRLRDLGAEANAIALALLCVISQRLARKICNLCKTEDTPSQELLMEFYGDPHYKETKFYRGAGCPACKFTGYKGREAIYEYWEPTPEARSLISKDLDDIGLRRQCLETGMKPLVVNALEKVDNGVISLDEVRRIVPYEQISALPAVKLLKPDKRLHYF
jgi:type IV pilus assembly protein PilB